MQLDLYFIFCSVKSKGLVSSLFSREPKILRKTVGRLFGSVSKFP